jgi:hypothetical protein
MFVDQQRGIGRDAIGGAVLSVFEDRSDRAVRAGAERQCAGAGDLDATGVEALDQAEDPDTGAEPLLRMRPGAQDHIDEHGGVGADRFSLAADPLVRPVAIAAVRTRHVLGHRAGPMRQQAAAMAGHTLAAVEDLDRRGGDPRLDLLAQ